MDIRSSIQRHPELFIQVGATLGVLLIFVTNLSVCFPSPSATELETARKAEQIRERLARTDRPALASTQASALVRGEFTRLSTARPGADGQMYFKTVLDKIIVLPPSEPGEPSTEVRERPVPVPNLQVTAGMDAVDLAWDFATKFDKKRSYTLSVFRIQRSGPGGQAPTDPSERTLASRSYEEQKSFRDPAVQPGCRYAYRVEVSEGVRKAASASLEASIPLPFRMVLSGVANGVAVISIEKWFTGRDWKKETVCVRPGDAVGGRRDTVRPVDVGSLDFATGFVVRDVREERPGAGSADPNKQLRVEVVVELAHPIYGTLKLTLEKK